MEHATSLIAWADAADAIADVDAGPLEDTLLAASPTRRLARLTLAPGARPGAALVIGGPRETLVPALQRLITEADHVWLARWLIGRWPRGPVTIDHPLDRRDAARTLGLVAPMPPTRLSLSASPLPFPRPSVQHFAALHTLTGEPGVSGCRLTARPDAVEALTARWSLQPAALPAIADHLGAGPAVRELLVPILADLERLAGRPVPVTVEATYDPLPRPLVTVEWGPVGLRLAASLARALLGDDAPLAAAAAALEAPAAFRMRLSCGASGLTALHALLPLPGDPLKGAW